MVISLYASHRPILSVAPKVTCPVGLERGNRVDVRTPSGVQVFQARVPSGLLGGDVFAVQVPVVSKTKEQAEHTEGLCGTFVHGLLKNCNNYGRNSAWNEIDKLLTPTPEVVGRAVAEVSKKQGKQSGWV